MTKTFLSNLYGQINDVLDGAVKFLIEKEKLEPKNLERIYDCNIEIFNLYTDCIQEKEKCVGRKYQALKVKDKCTNKIYTVYVKVDDVRISNGNILIDLEYELEEESIMQKKCYKKLCPVCNGKGYIKQQASPINPNVFRNVQCPECKGTGVIEICYQEYDNGYLKPYV